VSLLDDLLAGADPPRPAPVLATAEAFRTASAPTVREGVSSHAVPDSPDLRRILALPRRTPPPVHDPTHPDVRALVERVTARHRRPDPPNGCTCHLHRRPCIRELSPAQAWALDEIAQVGGLLGPIPVGAGKTGLGLLAPMALRDCRVAVLLIPPNLREQLKREYDLWSQHFTVPSIRWDQAGGVIHPGRPVVHVVPYSLFSRPSSTALLDSIRPDTIIADEGQKLRDRTTSTTGRVVRHVTDAAREGRRVRFLAWSGTITKGSITDYSHLAAFALRDGSPVPLDPEVAKSWATAIDPIPSPAPPGALRQLGPGPVDEAYGRRLRETTGWVAPQAGSVTNGLVLREQEVRLPDGIRKALIGMRSTWTRPDGEELIDAMQVARSARELACGFFYRWKFPRGEPEDLIRKWFAARKAWHRELRDRLKDARPHLDSEHLATLAAERGLAAPVRRPAGTLAGEAERPVWFTYAYAAWREVRDLVEPVSDTVWLDALPPDFAERARLNGSTVEPCADAAYLVHDAAAWAKKHRGVVWYEHEAFGARLERDHGLPRHAGGASAEGRILAEDGSRSIAASVKAHGTGRDGLQRVFSRQLVVCSPSSGDTWEQLLGRLHRVGQSADEVETWVYRHTPELCEAFEQATAQALYTKATIGTPQKILQATIEWAD